MNKALVIVILIVIAALGAGGVFLFRGTDNTARNGGNSASSLVPVTQQKGTAGVPQKSAPKVYSQTITIDSQSFFFRPDLFRVKVGEKVTVTVNSHGNHTFAIDEFKLNVKTADGKNTQFSFTPNKKGAFPYYSSVPGDREAGQQGMLIVE